MAAEAEKEPELSVTAKKLKIRATIIDKVTLVLG